MIRRCALMALSGLLWSLSFPGWAVPGWAPWTPDSQESLARTGKQVSYVVLTAEGPPHERHFTCAAVVGGEQLGVGEGNSKKAAEQEAAREALERLGAGAGP